jgi:hypothetical protein
MRLLVFAAIAVAIAAPAPAAVLPFTATLELSFGNTLPVTVVDAGVATVNSSGGGAHLTRIEFAGGVISGTALQPITDPGAFPITGFGADVANLAGTIAETTGGELRGAMGLAGVLKVCLFGTTGACVAPTANVSVPLTPVGQGGLATSMGAVFVSVIGAPWTIGTAFVGSASQMGYAHGPASGTSSTAQVGGSMRLVTPVFFSTNIGASVNIPVFAMLTLHFVPEPATALLLGGGIALLCWSGRARR